MVLQIISHVKRKKALFEKLKRKFEMNIGIYYTRPLKDKMVYKARDGIEIKIKGYGFFFISTFPMCRFKPLLFLYSMLWTIIVQGNVRQVQHSLLN